MSEANLSPTGLSLSQKQQISRRLGIDLLGTSILFVGLLWSWRYTSQEEIGLLAQALGALLVSANIVWVGLRSLGRKTSTNYSDQLVAIAVVAAFCSGDFVTATLVPLALDVGRLFEERTAFGIQKTIQNIRSLQVEKVSCLVEKKEEERVISQVNIGDILIVRAGERIAADGKVLFGVSEIDQSIMTGESHPELVEKGSTVFAGSSNLSGLLHIEVTKLGQESALGQIIQSLQEVEASKIPLLAQIEGWLGHYMPLALAISATLLFFTEDINRAIAVLVVSFPTALAIAGPATMVAAFSKASSFSLFIKDARLFQKMKEIDAVVFDKTGTLTTGNLEIASIMTFHEQSEDDIIASAAQVAQVSKHPVSRAIIERAEAENIVFSNFLQSSELPGKGVSVQTEEGTIRLGRLSWLQNEGVFLSEEQQHKEGTGLSVDSELFGLFTFQDQVREEAQTVLQELHRRGIAEIWMLTGDREEEALSVSNIVGLENVKAEVLPQQKQELVVELQQEHTVLMIGDGINDAIALSQADVGIAFGASLHQAVAGGADATLLSHDLSAILALFSLSDKVYRTIVMNIVIAIVFALLMLFLAGTGEISAVMAAILHNVGAVLVIMNASFLLRE